MRMRVILADDQPEVRSALRLLLEEKPGIQVLAEASTTRELLQQVRDNCPDLLLLDWELPGNDPAGLISLLRALCPQLTVIALSSRPQAKPAAVEAGVRHFICKSEPPEQLLTALDNCYNRE
jgi:DNA-binding NarL/FixJ family response regulator